jgi:hypothetical protein
VLVFLDTEFTDLVIRPRLLSVGLVAERRAEREFYAEVTDLDRIRATNWYGLGAVLPQFGRIAHAACRYLELGGRLSAYLGELAADLRPGECIELAFGYHLDWDLVDLALRDADPARWASLKRRVRPLNVHELTSVHDGRFASEAYFKAQADGPIARHHALCDARALRLAYEAATRASARQAVAA